jgi:hypothetical protein
MPVQTHYVTQDFQWQDGIYEATGPDCLKKVRLAYGHHQPVCILAA